MKKIILIDDQPIANFIARKLLQLEGYEEGVIDFSNPEEALELVLEEKEAIIFLDLNMPEMTGWEFLEKIQHQDHGHKVFILTSSTSEVDREKAQSFPDVLDYIVKPLDRQKIASISLLFNNLK